MSKEKTIQLYLLDGSPKGIVKCSLSNWTGIAYKIPRTQLDETNKNKNLSNYLTQSGIYMLFGTSDETGEDIVYIGQAGARNNGNGILARLQEHKRNDKKDYFTEAVIFTTANNSFGPTEISYLENKFTSLAIKANRYQIDNKCQPTLGNVTEEKEAELEEFIDYTKIVVGALGYKVFDPITETNKATKQNDDLLYLKNSKANATGKQVADGFVVLKGSKLSKEISEFAVDMVTRYRKRAKLNDECVLEKDILFGSPSTAGVFVNGRTTNGRAEWKNKQGQSINEIESEK